MKSLFALLVLTSLAGSGRAQISLTSDDFIAYGFGLDFPVGTSSIGFRSHDTTGLQLLVNHNGSNQTWDFSGRAYTVSDVKGGTISLLPYPSGAALADDPDFASATHVYKYVSTDPKDLWMVQFLFVKIDSTGFWWLGVSQDSLGVASKQNVYAPPAQQLKFPLTYGTSWQSTYTVWDAYSSSLDTQTVSAIVDGFGTLITPPATSTPALRLRRRMSYQPGSSGDYTYYLLTNSFYSAEIDADQNGQPYAANYSEPTGSGSVAASLDLSGNDLLLSLSTNPFAKAETKLSYTMKQAGNVRVQLMDLLGHNVRVLESGRVSVGQHHVVIDTKSLSLGTYFIQVVADGGSATRKLVVTR